MPMISLYSKNNRIQAELSALLTGINKDWPEPIRTQTFSDFSAFLDSGRRNPCRILLLAQEGAEGVELVSTAVEECPESPVVWLSDLDFALFSYRLEVDHFGMLPTTEESLRTALRNCENKCRHIPARPPSCPRQPPPSQSLATRLAKWLRGG